MAVISFRTPQEGIEQFQKATDLMALIHEIATNPTVGDTIKALSDQLAQAQEMSDEKKQAVLDAEEIITQSKEILEDFEKEKAAYAIEVKASKGEISAARQSLDSDQKDFENQKTALQELVKKTQTDADQKLADAIQLSDDSKDRLDAAKKLETSLAAEQAEHEKAVKEFEDAKAQAEADLEVNLKQLEDGRAELAADVAALDDRKKKLDELFKE